MYVPSYSAIQEDREFYLRHFTKQQHNLCAVCHSVPPDVLDHNHSTDTIRGAVCFACNKHLGNVETHRQPPTPDAKAYLDKYGWSDNRPIGRPFGSTAIPIEALTGPILKLVVELTQHLSKWERSRTPENARLLESTWFALKAAHRTLNQSHALRSSLNATTLPSDRRPSLPPMNFDPADPTTWREEAT